VVQAWNPTETNDMPKEFNMLFLCTGNSARSIIAEVLANHVKLNSARFHGFSAGSRAVRSSIRARRLAGAASVGRGLRSKSWEEFAQPSAPTMDFVFTVCDKAAAEVCPVWPGQPMTAHWGVPDPAAAVGSEEPVRRAFRDTMVILKRRIELLACLPIDKLGRLALGEQLREIGRQ
jgi:arsenate reductase (thioredoxin)